MAGEVEAVGQMTTAGLALSALDGPAARGAAMRPAREPREADDLAHGSCVNCGAVLGGPFCATCGQSAHVHRSVSHIFEEFLHGVWHFDSKAWRTLPLLIFRPGRLTRDYVYGKRASYIAPLALFLFSIFLMFFVFGMLGGPDVNGALAKANAGHTPLTEARSDLADARHEVVAAESEIASAKADRDTPAIAMRALEAALAKQRANLAMAQSRLTAAEAAPAVPVVPGPEKTWQERLSEAAHSNRLTVNTGFPAINANVRNALQNPDFALYKIEQKAYKLSFLLIPLSLPALWLLFVFRRDVHTYDHVVFALYSLSFMSLLFIAIALLAKIDSTAGTQNGGGDTSLAGGIGGFLIFAAPVHIFAQLKGAYRLGVFGALWRTVVLTITSLMTLGIFAVLIVAVGLAD